MKVVILHGEDALEPPVDPVIEQVTRALQAGGHDAETLGVATEIEPVVHELRARQPDLVFNLTESFRDKSALDSNLAALLNLLGLHYTGSSPSGLILAGDKSLSKKMLRFHRIATPDFATVFRGALDHAGELRFPVIVKPPQEDASIGISDRSVVHDLASLLRRIDELQDAYRSPVLVEEFVDGREFYVGVLGNAHAEALPVIELEFAVGAAHPNRIASFDVKWSESRQGDTRSVFPADLPDAMVLQMQRMAMESLHALRLRDNARIDMRLNQRGEIFVIEANPNCYLERNGEFARAAERAGITYDALIERLVVLATARYAR